MPSEEDKDKREIFSTALGSLAQRADHWGTLGPPKTAAGRREIPMARPVLKVLRDWRLAYPFGKDGIVFCSLNRANPGGVLGHVELYVASPTRLLCLGRFEGMLKKRTL